MNLNDAQEIHNAVYDSDREVILTDGSFTAKGAGLLYKPVFNDVYAEYAPSGEYIAVVDSLGSVVLLDDDHSRILLHIKYRTEDERLDAIATALEYEPEYKTSSKYLH